MIQIETNAPRYTNDLAEVARLFDNVQCATRNAQCVLSENVAVAWIDGYPSVTLPIPKIENDPWEQKRQEKRALKRCLYAALQAVCPTELPWGSLTGIRPTALLRQLGEHYGEAEALRMFREDFDVSAAKTALAREICAVQGPLWNSLAPNSLDVYIGIPYCRSRCLYCSFGAEVSRRAGELNAYLRFLLQDIAAGAAIVKEGGYILRALYIGGGTPTVFTAEQLRVLLSAVREAYDIGGREFTVEAGRPDTITPEKLRVLCDTGVTRISVNPQTMVDATLRRIGRAHSAEDTRRAMSDARAAGFTHINMDIIAGLPGETIADMEYTLAAIRALHPESLTVHTLAVKRSSRLKEQLEITPLPDANTATQMLQAADAAARGLGLLPYYMYRQKYMRGSLENVGYALPGHACLYNADMMEETSSVLAHGAGAMSKRVFPGRDVRVERIPNPKDVGTYCGKLAELDRRKRALFLL
ncbi:MAG: coproporphyrinogen dehydrogenase HemZ [Clostridiales bacterium]|nr:coproporphyrinogen dehydrogenase HemZ [Clostridiales bacterium]